MINFLKKHFGIILLAIVVSIFTFGPQLFAINKIGNDFRGVYPINTADDIYYLARAQDISDGHNFLANPYLYEHKDSSPMQFWLPDYIMAKPLAIFGVEPAIGYIFYDLLLSIILVILIYSILFSLTKNRLLSLSATTFLHLGLFLVVFSRAPSPQLNFIFYLLLLLFLIKYIQTKKKIFVILATFIFGLLFYIYPYYWTFFAASMGVFLIGNLLWKKKIKWNYIFLMIGGFVIGLPYFISMLISTKLPFYEQSIYRLGMINTHFPSGIKIIFLFIVALILFAIAYKKKIIKINELSILLISNIMAAVICVNQHVITGKNLEFSSHYWDVSIFSFVFLIFYLLAKFLQKTSFKIYQNKIAIILLVLVLVFAFVHQKNQILSDAHPKEQEIYWQQYMPLFEWLNQNSNKESVVYANSDLSNLIPVYTRNNIYYNRFANLFFISDQEVQERFIINNYWENFDEEFIFDHQRYIWGVHYIDQYGHNLSKNKLKQLLFLPVKDYEQIPQSEIDKFIDLVNQMQAGDLKDYLFNYRVDYFIWDKNKNPNWQVDNLDFLENVYYSRNFTIYRVDHL